MAERHEIIVAATLEDKLSDAAESAAKSLGTFGDEVAAVSRSFEKFKGEERLAELDKQLDASINKIAEFGGTVEDQIKAFENLLDVAQDTGKPIAVLAKMQGKLADELGDGTKASMHLSDALKLQAKTGLKAEDAAAALGKVLKGDVSILKTLGPAAKRAAESIEKIVDPSKRAAAAQREMNRAFKRMDGPLAKARDGFNGLKASLAPAMPLIKGVGVALVAVGAAAALVTAAFIKMVSEGLEAYIEQSPIAQTATEHFKESIQGVKEAFGGAIMKGNDYVSLMAELTATSNEVARALKENDAAVGDFTRNVVFFIGAALEAITTLAFSAWTGIETTYLVLADMGKKLANQVADIGRGYLKLPSMLTPFREEVGKVVKKLDEMSKAAGGLDPALAVEKRAAAMRKTLKAIQDITMAFAGVPTVAGAAEREKIKAKQLAKEQEKIDKNLDKAHKDRWALIRRLEKEGKALELIAARKLEAEKKKLHDAEVKRKEEIKRLGKAAYEKRLKQLKEIEKKARKAWETQTRAMAKLAGERVKARIEKEVERRKGIDYHDLPSGSGPYSSLFTMGDIDKAGIQKRKEDLEVLKEEAQWVAQVGRNYEFLGQLATSTTTAIAEGWMDATAAMMASEMTLKDFGSTMVTVVGDALQSAGKQMAMYAITQAGVFKALGAGFQAMAQANPVGLFAAGAALLVAGALMNRFFAGGGGGGGKGKQAGAAADSQAANELQAFARKLFGETDKDEGRVTILQVGDRQMRGYLIDTVNDGRNRGEVGI